MSTVLERPIAIFSFAKRQAGACKQFETYSPPPPPLNDPQPVELPVRRDRAGPKRGRQLCVAQANFCAACEKLFLTQDPGFRCAPSGLRSALRCRASVRRLRYRFCRPMAAATPASFGHVSLSFGLLVALTGSDRLRA